MLWQLIARSESSIRLAEQRWIDSLEQAQTDLHVGFDFVAFNLLVAEGIPV